MVTMRTGLTSATGRCRRCSPRRSRVRRRSGLRADLRGRPAQPLSPRKQVELLRIVQEALTNVRKHADATVVRVRAEAADDRLMLGIADNGRGFRPDESSGEAWAAGHEGAGATDGR